MPGTLYLVATPIGNLEDITIRALRILGEVRLIAAEDTRRTAKLLRHYRIETATTSLHDHNERRRTPALVERLRSGESIALLSDAGTPLVSDPGWLLVRESLDAGVSVVALPGASAVMTALVSSGAPTHTFTFVGFPPRRLNDRKKWCEALASETRTVIFFEAPHRLVTTLKLMKECCGNRMAALCRELTKIHEELVIRPISELSDVIVAPRGEYTCVVWPAAESLSETRERPRGQVLLDEIYQLTEKSTSRRSALKQIASSYGVTSRVMYREIEEAKKLSQKT